MAFGDVQEVKEYGSSGYESNTGAITLAGTPSAGDLLVCNHFTGDSSTNIPSGFTNSKVQTDSTNSDELRQSHKYVSSGSDNTVTCTTGGSDSQMVHLIWIEGAFESTSILDVAHDAGGPDSSGGPTATGASSSSTAQADESLIAAMSVRSTGQELQTGAWARQGTATPTSDMDNRATTDETVDGAKQINSGTQTLTGIGTIGASKTWNAEADVVMVAICSYKKLAAAGGGGPRGPLGHPVHGAFGGPVG